MQNLALEHEYEKHQNSLEYVEYVGKIQITMGVACEGGQDFDDPRDAHHNEQLNIHGKSVGEGDGACQ